MTSRYFQLLAKLIFQFMIIILSLGLCQSCQKEDLDMTEEEVVQEDEDCSYVFAEGLSNIFGTWAPKIVIDHETGDSTFYADGKGHMGHMLTNWYSDSFELRDNGNFNIFYISMGKPCKEESFGDWGYKGEQLDFYFFNKDTVTVPVISVDEYQLIIEDIVNHKPSEVIMRKIE